MILDFWYISLNKLRLRQVDAAIYNLSKKHSPHGCCFLIKLLYAKQKMLNTVFFYNEFKQYDLIITNYVFIKQKIFKKYPAA